jgi:hypothetical protein
MSTKTKLLASAALLAAAAGAAGLGTFGSFTSTTSSTQAVTSGTVVIGVGAAGTANNRLSVAATGVVPGDTIQRTVQLNNTGNQNLASITLTTSASPSSLLDTDSTNGLQFTIQKCASLWAETGTSPAYTYTCAGGATTVLATHAIIGSNLALAGLSALTAGASDNLMVTVTLPPGAGNTLQGQSSTVAFSFTGTQRNATNQ